MEQLISRPVEGLDRYTTKKNKRFLDWAVQNWHRLSFGQCMAKYREIIEKEAEWGSETVAAMGLLDRFFLLTVLLRRPDAFHPWLFDRCREHEADPFDHLDLWAREHYKSTIITFAHSIQEALQNPNLTSLILSHNEKVSKKFLRQIKQEFESNKRLQKLYPDVIWENPKVESPKWSEQDGIVLNRSANYGEPTIGQCGLVDGLPVGSHYHRLRYDDVVTKDSVGTVEAIEKTTEAFRHSLSLGVRRSEGGKRQGIGTRYHNNDTWRVALADVVFKGRTHAATHNGKEPEPWGDGVPVFRTLEEEQEWRRIQGPWVYGSQQLQNPTVDKLQGFKEEWLQYWEADRWGNMNIYILCDPASEKKKDSDYTVFMVIGLASDGNIYVIDMIRDRLRLTERSDKLFDLHRKYFPKGVGWEKYGKDSDIEHIESEMEHEHYRFHIQGLGGKTAKADRIKGLIPKFEQGLIYLPERCNYVNYEGASRNLTRDFVEEEYKEFPLPQHDDMLDCMARILDPKFPTKFPKRRNRADVEDGYLDPKIVSLAGHRNKQMAGRTWISR